MTRSDRHPDDSLLASYTAGALSPGRRRAIGRHLDACARCRGIASDWVAVRGALTALDAAEPAPSADILVGAWARIDAAAPARRADRRPGWGRWPIAAGLAAAAIGACRLAPHGTAALASVIPLATAVAVALALSWGRRASAGGANRALSRPALGVRFAAALGYAGGVGLLASLIVEGTHYQAIGPLVLTWVGPAVLLGAVSLVVSRLSRPSLGGGSACVVCLLHGLALLVGGDATAPVPLFALALRALWATTPLVVGVSSALTVLALALTPRAPGQARP